MWEKMTNYGKVFLKIGFKEVINGKVIKVGDEFLIIKYFHYGNSCRFDTRKLNSQTTPLYKLLIVI